MNNSTYPTEMSEPASPPLEALLREPGKFIRVREPTLDDLLAEWREELDNIKTRLAEIGERGESFEYNILSASALRLSECIADLAYIEAWWQGKAAGGANE